MTAAQRPRLYVIATGAMLLIMAVGFWVLPRLAKLQQTRQNIDATRIAIASVKNQQENIEAVSQDFEKIQADAQLVEEVFLRESESVNFFNRVDEAFASSGIDDSLVRIDTPIKGTPMQPVGIHLSFKATFSQTLSLLRTLRSLKPLITIETVALNATEGTSRTLSITIDGTVPWEEEARS